MPGGIEVTTPGSEKAARNEEMRKWGNDGKGEEGEGGRGGYEMG